MSLCTIYSTVSLLFSLITCGGGCISPEFMDVAFYTFSMMLKGEYEYDHILIKTAYFKLTSYSHNSLLCVLDPLNSFGTNIFALCLVSFLMVSWFVIIKKEEFVEPILCKVLMITTQIYQSICYHAMLE